MRHRIAFREITPEDLDRHCPFMPEPHEFDMHLAALAHEALWVEGVSSVERDGSHAIVVDTDSSEDVLKQRLVPLLQHHWASLRIRL